jgi:GNAT superfamily N-acetyltransferase
LYLVEEKLMIRQATVTDISGIQVVRNSVKENMLSDPALVTDLDCQDFIERRGMGWVCEIDGKIVGFSIVDLVEKNVWALFVHPDHEGSGIGRKLHDVMINWYFNQTNATIWLGTSPNTRAYHFYKSAGWAENGLHGKGEIKFEMTALKWNSRNKN